MKSACDPGRKEQFDWMIGANIKTIHHNSSKSPRCRHRLREHRGHHLDLFQRSALSIQRQPALTRAAEKAGRSSSSLSREPAAVERAAGVQSVPDHWPKGSPKGRRLISNTRASATSSAISGAFPKRNDSSSPTSLSWMGYFIDWVAALGHTETVLADQLTAQYEPRTRS